MEAIREEGSVPVLVALVDGYISIGASNEIIELFADHASKVQKVSRRDVAYYLATKALGATTVSATMLAAHLAGIRIFATGGIGGVHR